MQNYEELSNTASQQATPETRTTNNDPREQPLHQERPYEDGYRGSLDERNIWSEGEKIQPEPKNKKGIEGPLLFVVLLCVILVAGSHLGFILGWLSWLIIAILVVAGLSLLAANWRVVTLPVPTQNFQVQEHARLTINNYAGTVSIRRGEAGQISVAATKRASGIGIDPASMQIMYNQRGDTLDISTQIGWNLLQFGMRSIHFEITVPEDCNLDARTGSGDASIQGISGTTRLQTGSGSIQADELRGQIAMKTGSGSVRLGQLQGQILAQTGSGRIECYGLQGQTSLKSGSGSIDLSSSLLAGISRLKTGSGRIDFEGTLDPQGNVQFHTGSGGITVSLPANAAFNLDAKTGSGGVKNEFGGNTVGYGMRTYLKLRTGSGGIRIYNRNGAL